MTLHATCIDGPLKGALFTIETCPRLVRCVRAADGTPDILNLPEDAPRLDEAVHWYRWDGTAVGFICGRKAFSATMIELRLAPAGVRPLQAPDPVNLGARSAS
jgi:hypothetical protein